MHWVALNTPDTSGGNGVDTEVFFVPSPAGLHTCQLKQQEAGGGPGITRVTIGMIKIHETTNCHKHWMMLVASFGR